MSLSHVTLRDIAQACGVSHVTVSLALRKSPKIPEARKLQIQQLAEKMGYRPNAMAAALAHHRRLSAVTPVQAVIAWLNCWPKPEQLRSHAEFDRYWHGASAAAENFGFRLEEFICGNRCPLPRLERILTTRAITGILIPPHPITPDWGAFDWTRFCALRFGRSVTTPRLHIISSDQVANTMLAFEQIQRRGYKRIGFVTGQLAVERGQLYKAGFLMAQSELPSKLRLPIFVAKEDQYAATQQRLARWLKETKPDAILTDLKESREMLGKVGCRVPDDVGLAALSVLDGDADAGIYQNPEEIGRVALLFVISLIHDNEIGVPPIYRQIVVGGTWRDGKTLPARQANNDSNEKSAARSRRTSK